MSAKTLLLHPNDNVAIALGPLTAGQDIARTDVPASHKVAVADIAQGAHVLRYGQIIGKATQPIETGSHVHDHNMDMSGHDVDYAFSSAVQPLPEVVQDRTFDGYHRANGRVGTRNYIGVLTSVNCSGSVARFIAEEATKSGLLDAYPNVDGIVPIVHSTGCGMSNRGDGYDILLRTLAGYAAHPNFGGILLVGLGCEVLQLADLVKGQQITADGPLRYMTIQQSGGTRRTIDRGVEHLASLAEFANRASRQPAPISELVLGMQCGGSDGYSGFTANPALGVASDMLVQHGATSILSETSEIYGAEHLLTRRAVTPEIGQALVDKLTWWEEYCARHGSKMDNNPSPGNKRGGLTTILEKSLGAVSKSGQAPLSGMFEYGAPLTAKGFVFMDSPGYDPCSVTGQVASGATLIAFTTGRGSVSGYMPTPCIKLASNSDMYTRMSDDMDVNCGDIVDGVSLADKGAEIFETLIAVASGQASKSEAQGFGGVEFVPWQMGAVL
ncbi:altronate hydrolase/galactarate dehydratase [Monaibacterium marinum]|uniref:Altronate hydrolase/galactarate dehydratase n=1 Tax=Pontivivens marinum TaxID=1690039 RepID=A0A2C9CV03_9RHOB|nr:altronate dehydratase family protein [Monaibacterium marinum]SOH94945.1 altronate hydrolase/galactarate dehydratase [Monaibacterium marinum]